MADEQMTVQEIYEKRSELGLHYPVHVGLNGEPLLEWGSDCRVTAQGRFVDGGLAIPDAVRAAIALLAATGKSAPLAEACEIIRALLKHATAAGAVTLENEERAEAFVAKHDPEGTTNG